MRIRVNIIGGGRVGKAIALSLKSHGHYAIQAICNRSLESAENACTHIGEGAPFSDIKQLPASDITLIATPDDAISTSAQALSECPQLKEESLVFHCSGLKSSAALSPCKIKYCLTASLHPIKSIADNEQALFNNTYCAIEGDTDACDQLTTLLTSLNGKPFIIKPSAKPLYHLGCVLASNYLVTLFDMAKEELTKAGIDENKTSDILLELMQGSLNNLASKDCTAESLTGPIARNDTATINTHLKAISDPLVLSLYKQLGQRTLSFATLTTTEKEHLTALFKDK